MNPTVSTPTGTGTPIAVTSLQTAQTPINVPSTPPATAVAGLSGAITANTDQFTQSLATQANSAQANRDSSLQALMDSLSGSQSQSQLTNDKYTQTVDPLQQQLTSINNQILAERVATQHQIDNLNANPGSMSRDALNAEISNIQRQSLSRQADLSVIQMAAQGQFNSAKAIADRAVQAQFEQQQQKNDILKYVYEQNKDLFTTAQQRQFEVAQKDRESAIDLAKQKEMARYNEIIKQNDPLYQAQAASARADAQLKQFQAGIIQGGGGINQNGQPISPTEYKNGVPITANAAASSSNPYDSQAYALATGLAAPSQYLSGRSATTPAGIALTRRANAISMAVNGTPYNPAASEAAFKFRNSQQYQRLTANIPTAIETIVQAAQAAQRLGLSNVQQLNSLNIQTKANGLQFWATPQQRSDAQTLQSLLALNQDDLGLILGTGQGSDYKTKLGGLIFNATGAPHSTADLTNLMVNKITDKLGQYYTNAGVAPGQAKAFAQQEAQQWVNSAVQPGGVDTSAATGGNQTSTASEGDTHDYNGVTYVVKNGQWVPQQ